MRKCLDCWSISKTFVCTWALSYRCLCLSFPSIIISSESERVFSVAALFVYYWYDMLVSPFLWKRKGENQKTNENLRPSNANREKKCFGFPLLIYCTLSFDFGFASTRFFSVLPIWIHKRNSFLYFVNIKYTPNSMFFFHNTFYKYLFLRVRNVRVRQRWWFVKFKFISSRFEMDGWYGTSYTEYLRIFYPLALTETVAVFLSWVFFLSIFVNSSYEP